MNEKNPPSGSVATWLEQVSKEGPIGPDRVAALYLLNRLRSQGLKEPALPKPAGADDAGGS
jgi:hypothetical protein